MKRALFGAHLSLLLLLQLFIASCAKVKEKSENISSLDKIDTDDLENNYPISYEIARNNEAVTNIIEKYNIIYILLFKTFS